MKLADMLEGRSLNELIYIGAKESSGFVWIGPVKYIPEKYLSAEVTETYRHRSNYPGTTVLIDEYGRRNGVWFLWEYDPTVPEKFAPLADVGDGYENLLAAIFASIATDYRKDLRAAIKHYKNVRLAIHKERCHYAAELNNFMKTETGQYAIQRIEDEEEILFRHPELKKLDVDDRAKEIQKYRKTMIRERSKRQGESRYATIKGKSVKRNESV